MAGADVFLVPRISGNYVDSILETWFTIFMAATHNPTTDREVAVNASINPTIWTKSAAGGTYFRFEGSTKFILFPAIGSTPELVITEAR